MKKQFALLALMGRGGALTKIHELIREMKVSRVMTPNVLTLTRDASMRELKELLREHRISGVPVVDEENELVGLVSTEDLIHALEQIDLDSPVGKYMTQQDLITAYSQEPVMEALRRFESSGVG